MTRLQIIIHQASVKIDMLLQAGPIAPSSIGIWALTFLLGGLSAVVAWLVRRHYAFAVPAYERIFGTEDDDTDDGHLVNSYERFNSIDDAVVELQRETDQVHDDVRKVERRQELVLSNQKTIANALDVDLDSPRVYRAGRGDVDRDAGSSEDD